jgi:hypothetical protein
MYYFSDLDACEDETPFDVPLVDATGRVFHAFEKKHNVPFIHRARNSRAADGYEDETPMDVPLVDANRREFNAFEKEHNTSPLASKTTSTPTNDRDDFAEAMKRPTHRARKRKAVDGDKKNKEPTLATTTAGLLDHLKEEGARRASNELSVATALNKILLYSKSGYLLKVNFLQFTFQT